MKKPDLKEILESDTPESKVRSAIADLVRVRSLVSKHTTLTNNQSEITDSITKVIGDLNTALNLLNKASSSRTPNSQA